jgi:hypothetical protein
VEYHGFATTHESCPQKRLVVINGVSLGIGQEIKKKKDISTNLIRATTWRPFSNISSAQAVRTKDCQDSQEMRCSRVEHLPLTSPLTTGFYPWPESGTLELNSQMVFTAAASTHEDQFLHSSVRKQYRGKKLPRQARQCMLNLRDHEP